MRKTITAPNKAETIGGFIFLAVQLLVLQTALLFINMLLPVPMTEAMLNFLFFSINFISVAVIFRKFLIRCGKNALSAPLACLKTAFLGFVAYWISSIFISALINSVYPEFFNVNDSNLSQMTQDNFLLMAIGTVLFVPVAEETLYRGLIFGKLYNTSPILAYIISTLAFAALHIVGYIGLYEPAHLLLCLLQYIPAGFCLGWAYAKANSIWAPVFIHISINLIAILSMR